MLDVADLLERYGTLLRSGGTNRLQRTLPALEEGYVEPDERDLRALLSYVGGAGAALRFHALSGQAAGDWSPLIDPLRDGAGAVLDAAALDRLLARRADLPPQLALLVAFLKTFRHVQDDLNRLPARHLSFYYEDVLRLGRRAAAPDRVHVLFEPTRTAGATRLAAGTTLLAGTDGDGRKRRYALTRETIVTRATIGEIARQAVVADAQGRRRLFRATPPAETGFATFGDDPFLPGTEMAEADPGFAITEPTLRLSEGRRSIAVEIRLSNDGASAGSQTLSNQVRIAVTGAEGWLDLPAAATVLSEDVAGPFLRITAALDESQPAIVDFDPALHGGGGAPFATRFPVLRCLVSSATGRAELLSRFAARSVRVAVEADGIADLVVQNDQRTLVAGGPLPLFGQRPRLGANFYIGSREAFSKRLDRLSLTLDWDGLPENLLDHYGGYFDFQDAVLSAIFLPSFTAVVDLLDGRSFDHRLTGPAGVMRLFAGNGPRQSITFAAAAIDGALGVAEYRADPDLEEADRYEVGTPRGFLRLRLTGPANDDLSTFSVNYAQEVPFDAFGHDAFAKRYANAAIDVARYDPNAPNPGVEPELPNEPYTPVLSALTLGYGASARFETSDIQAHGRFFTLGAFGHTTGGPATPARLVPDHGERAELMIGLADFDAPGTVSMLFQLADGTARVADPPAPEDIGWSYLSGDEWIDLPPSALVVDETRGFQTPGVVAVAIGHDATRTHTAMTPGLTWLRARLSKPASVAARTDRLYPQAATAEFITDDPEGLAAFDGHLSAGLPPGAVTRLEQSLPAIKSVSQPYASFGGRPAEADRAFFERGAERLRHRARGVTAWDFEHLVLERVDGVFKVRALPHRDAMAREAAGQLALVIVPSRFASQSANRLEPRAGETLMEEIRDVVETGIASPFAQVNVIHPVFERIRVFARVAFRPGFDPGFYSARMNEDLQRFLSPWAFEEGRDIVFGTHVYRSELLKFVEDRDYVDYVTRFDVYHAYDGPTQGGIGVMEIGLDFVVGSEPDPAIAGMTIGEDFIVGRPVEAAQSTRPDAVLVSHPEHIVEPVFPGTESCSGVSELGIGYMIVGLDFIVSSQ